MTEKKEKISNPLTRYHDVSRMSWADISRRTGIPRQTISEMSKMPPFKMGEIRLRTAHAIKKNLGIDMLKYLDELDKLRT